MANKKIVKPTVKKTAKAVVKKAVAKKPAKKATKKAVKKVVKKVAKKTAAKQPKAKAVAKKSTAPVLVCANGSECFWTNDGQILRDLNELAAALEKMKASVYKHHTSAKRHDFADWVEHVLDDKACATALRKARKADAARVVVVKHLKYYKL